MSDKIVIDRDRLVSLRQRLITIEPDKSGGVHDSWVFAMQNVANMLENDNAVPLCTSCWSTGICNLQTDDKASCEFWRAGEAPVVKNPVDPRELRGWIAASVAVALEQHERKTSGADRYATLQDVREAMEPLASKIENHCKDHDNAPHAAIWTADRLQDLYHRVAGNEDALDKALNTLTDRIRAIEQRQALQVDSIGKRLEVQHLVRTSTECYLEDGTLLWEVPYGFRSMFKAGQDLIENHKRYIVISAEMVGKTQHIIVREEPR
jgi:hypothetical protein